jgi:hypothetical protein
MSGTVNPDTRRVGRKQLDTIAANLDRRDWVILRDLATFRLMSGQQLRHSHFHGHASQAAATRAASGTLRRLRTLGVIRPLERRIGGKRAGSEGYLWHLTTAGSRLLALSDDNQATPISRFAAVEPSARMVNHTLAVSEIAVKLRQAEHIGQIEIIKISPEPGCWRPYLGSSGARLILKPDLYAITATPGSDWQNLWFIEVDLATESRATIQTKIAAYQAYRRSGVEQHRTGAFPLVLWLTPSQDRAETILQTIHHIPRCDQPVHHATQLHQLIETITNPPNIQTQTQQRSLP